MTKKQIFTAAHKMAKTFIGAYSACLSLALKTIYAAMKNETTVNLVGTQNTYAIEIKTEFVTYSLFELTFEIKGCQGRIIPHTTFNNGKQECKTGSYMAVIIAENGQRKYANICPNSSVTIEKIYAKGNKKVQDNSRPTRYDYAMDLHEL